MYTFNFFVDISNKLLAVVKLGGGGVRGWGCYFCFSFAAKKPALREEDGMCIREAKIKGWIDATGSTDVVVKTMTDKSNKEAKACLIEELNILLSVGRHLNIDNLLGVVVEGTAYKTFKHSRKWGLSFQ